MSRISESSTASRIILLASVAVAACASVGTVRPPFPPLYQALVDTVRADTAALIEALEERIIAEGLEIRISSVLDAYVETRWFNVVTGRSDDGDVAHPEREILLRFWVDPLGPLGYQLTAEAVFRRVSDPSLPSRQREVMIPPGHDGEAILLRILNSLRERFGG